MLEKINFLRTLNSWKVNTNVVSLHITYRTGDQIQRHLQLTTKMMWHNDDGWRKERICCDDPTLKNAYPNGSKLGESKVTVICYKREKAIQHLTGLWSHCLFLSLL